MNTLVFDLRNLVCNHLNVVEYFQIVDNPVCDHVNYKLDPKWLLYISSNKDELVKQLIENKQHDWLMHLVIYGSSDRAFRGLCRLKNNIDLLTLAHKTNNLVVYNDELLRTSIISGSLDDFIRYARGLKQFKGKTIRDIYRYGHQNIIDHVEKHHEKILRVNKKVIHGMIKCVNRTYDPQIMKTMLLMAIQQRFEYIRFLQRCSKYTKYIKLIINVFGPRCYKNHGLIMLDAALSKNNLVVADYIIEHTEFTDKIKYEFFKLCVKWNSTYHIVRFLTMDIPQPILFTHFNLTNTTIETIDLIYPHLYYKPSQLEIEYNFKCTGRYDLFCHLMKLI